MEMEKSRKRWKWTQKHPYNTLIKTHYPQSVFTFSSKIGRKFFQHFTIFFPSIFSKVFKHEKHNFSYFSISWNVLGTKYTLKKYIFLYLDTIKKIYKNIKFCSYLIVNEKFEEKKNHNKCIFSTLWKIEKKLIIFSISFPQ